MTNLRSAYCRICRLNGDELAQKAQAQAESGSITFIYFVSVISRAVGIIFVLYVHGASVAFVHQDSEELRPINLTLPGDAIPPPLRGRGRIDSGPMEHVVADLRVLEVNVVNMVHPVARSLVWVHKLTDVVRRIKLDPYIGRISKSLEERLVADGAGSYVGSFRPWLPDEADLILLTKRKVMFFIDAADLIDLGVQFLRWIFAGHRADVRNTELSGGFDDFRHMLVRCAAFCGIGIDVVRGDAEDRTIEPRLLQVFADLVDRQGVFGLGPDADAGKAFLLRKRHITGRVIDEYADFRRPHSVTLRSRPRGGGGEGSGGYKCAPRISHAILPDPLPA